MPVLTADRTPGQLVAELERFVEVDWPTVWAGVPEDEDERGAWCAGFGWRPLWFQGGQWVRTARGGRLHLASAAPGRPVTAVAHAVWSVRAGTAAENEALTALTAAKWPAYVAAVRSALSAPTWSGDWDTAGFPDPPGRGYWQDPEWRAEHRDPYRLAVWSFRTPGAPLFVLKANLAAGTSTGWGPGSATISFACHGPADPEDPQDDGPGWLL
ncbi:hypothetical protein KMT30_39210 [Streptomyces sp. IBSBF 2953]|uniref:hypothetical protein n=1 Tax=Streptomyces TaxID=1883 RepID=UPI0029BD9FD4|nr:hypothetical protein [Streptomyces scabiei]MCQ9184961.1 hypothetical protein [Streptomyces hayashii]MDX3119660.1 hypothetical protein [Streptomyces scabiei]